MIERQKPEALAIAVVPQHQPEIILHAMERGVSVLAEKPLALSLDEAKDLLTRAEAAKVAHMVDFLFPEIPAWRKAKELLGEGAVGRVLRVTTHWSFLSYDLRNRLVSWKTDPAQGGGALSFFFSHEFYNVEYLLGKMVDISCTLESAPDSPNHGETAVKVSAHFESGCPGDFYLNCGARDEQRHFLVFQGEKGTLRLENVTASLCRGWTLTHYDERGGKQVIDAGELKTESGVDERVPLVQAIGERFVGWCQGKGPARPSFEDGCRVQQLMEAARVSAAEQVVRGTDEH